MELPLSLFEIEHEHTPRKLALDYENRIGKNEGR